MTTLSTTHLSAGERALAEDARRAVSGVATTEPLPGDFDAENLEARTVLKRIAGAGLLGHVVPPGYRPDDDASPVSVRKICAIREALAHVSGLADVMFVMQGLGSWAISLAGSEETRRRWLQPVAEGRSIAAIAMTEPDAGSDVGSMQTRATRDGHEYVLDGVKTYISNAGIADFYTLFARTGEEGSTGLSAFVVEADRPGFTVRERITISAPHPIGTLEFSGCRIPAGQRLGDEGKGFDIAMRVLDRFRPTVGAAATGLALRAFDESVERASSRRQFGRPIAKFQAIRFKLADMATCIEAARLLFMRAAALIDAGSAPDESIRRASAMAKLFATEGAQHVIDEAVQIHGAIGVTRGGIIERLYREVRALRIYEGTSEVQRLVIAGTLRSGH